MLVRKHFGLTITEINSTVSWGEWICLYATALDQEEMENYMDALRAGMKKDEWKWSHADIARRMNSTTVKGGIRPGDKPLRDRSNRQIEGTVRQLFGAKEAHDITGRYKGTAQEAAIALGYEMVDAPEVIPDGYVWVEYDPTLERTTIQASEILAQAESAPAPEKSGGLLGMLSKVG